MKYAITIKNLPGCDGEYPFPEDLLNEELRTIKKMSGVRAGEIQDALNAGDNDVVVALAAIALRREERRFAEQELWQAKAGDIDVIEVKVAEPEGDASPPADGSSSGQDEKNTTSGSSSSNPGEPSQATESPNGSGTPDSDTGAISDLVTSEG